MKEEFSANSRKYLFWGIIICLVITSFLIIKPYIVGLLSAFILAYLIRPLYTPLAKKMKKPLAAILAVSISLFFIILPISLLVYKLISQISSAVSSKELISLTKEVQRIPFLESFNIQPFINQATSSIISNTSSIFFSIVSLVITIFISLVGTYYLLQNWSSLSEYIKIYIPFKKKDSLFKEIGEATRNIVYGYLVVAVLEFIVGFIGFYLSGVRYFILLPALMGILAFIPALGPGTIWIPTALYYLSIGNYLTFTGVLVTGLLITIVMDNIVAPKIVGSRSNIHPMIMLIGIFGGVSLFGIFGFIIGPLILVYTIKIVEEAFLKE